MPEIAPISDVIVQLGNAFRDKRVQLSTQHSPMNKEIRAMCNKHHTIHLCPSPSIHLEHTELLADVGKTVRLLDLVLNDVESHRLGQGSGSHSNNERTTCTDQWSRHHLPSPQSRESSERGCCDVSSRNYAITLSIHIYRLYFLTYLR